MDKPAVLLSRRVFAEVIARLREHCEVETNERDEVWTQPELIRRLQGKAGVFVTGSERIDAPLLDACPALRAVCSMAVGYNNIDVAACSARGVLVSNAPDVLTETTADFGFALLLAAARRIGESERFLRRGEWNKWSVDLFAGADVHGATLGVLGMGRIGQAIARRGALGFGMKVLYHNRSRLDAAIEARLGARHVGKQELLARQRPPGRGRAVQRGVAPPGRRGRTGADEAGRDAGQHRARRCRRRPRAGRGTARAPHRGGRRSMCSKASRHWRPSCSASTTSC